jgi:nucleoside-diphosphate-sugar epimerase
MKRALLTGATGFVGRQAIAPLLARGFEVHAASRQGGESGPGVTWHDTDLLSAPARVELVETVRPTHLLHFGWYVEHGEFWSSPRNLDWVAASLSLLRLFTGAGGRRVVMAGTCAEYSWDHPMLSESSTLLEPATLYGNCKHSLQLILSAFALQAGISAAWGRIFFTYGPHEAPGRLVASVIRSLLDNEVAACSHGRQIRDFLYVKDLADAFVALLDSTVDGPVNLASGRSVTLREVVEIIGRQIGRPELIELGVVPASTDDPAELSADVSRLRDEVGWSPEHSLDSGLEETIEWWKR